MSGVPLTTKPPFRYMKNPNNKDAWLVDEPAMEIVRKIFDLCADADCQAAKSGKDNDAHRVLEQYRQKMRQAVCNPFRIVMDTITVSPKQKNTSRSI